MYIYAACLLAAQGLGARGKGVCVRVPGPSVCLWIVAGLLPLDASIAVAVAAVPTDPPPIAHHHTLLPTTTPMPVARRTAVRHMGGGGHGEVRV